MTLGMSKVLQEKWAPVLDHGDLDPITDNYKKAVTSILLENQEKVIRQERQILSEAVPTMNTDPAGTGNPGFSSSGDQSVAGFDPVLISLIRRAMPNLVAYDLAGVQPMSGPTGLIFAMRARYDGPGTGNAETFFNEVNPNQSGTGGANDVSGAGPTLTGDNPAVLNDAFTGSNEATVQGYYSNGSPMSTQDSEALDSDGNAPDFREMGFSIEKISVTAKSRALKAEYSIELAQDLRAIHGLDAESELANILSSEILAEINREIVRTIYKSAKRGAQFDTATAGTFDLDVDSNGRWSVEKFKGLMFQIERDANAIARETRRGKGNMIMCSADVASALAMAGALDYAPAIEGNNRLAVDETGNTFAGILNGRYRVYIDPYATITRGGTASSGNSGNQYYVIGYKGSSPYDAGLFYCPYVPLQMVRSVGQDDFQPRIGFKTRYGVVLNPFAKGYDSTLTNSDPQAAANLSTNVYYRRVSVANLM
tara:strand:+ start:1846 stop:3291 length:1446 start_codon:yes stop_codon:yes gene_type:complete